MPRFAAEDTDDTCQAPPATVFLHALHDQMPMECRLTVFLPQNEHAVSRQLSALRPRRTRHSLYFACWEISIFLTCFLNEAP